MHKAIITKIDAVKEIPGADRIQIAYVLGESVIVGKELSPGDTGIFFPTDLQLSEEYCYHNNLYRDKTKNKNQDKAGFFENTRRVRTQPFLKVKSQGLFMPLNSLDYTGLSVTHGNGFQFNEWNGQTICQKYISESAKEAIANAGTRSIKKKEVPFFEKHVDTEQLKYNIHNIKKGDILYFHNKRHGTSFRIAKLQKEINLPMWKQKINKIVPIFKTKTDYQLIVGTRNVIIENEDKIGYNGSEKFRFDVANEIYPYLEDGMSVFGEIVGYVNGAPIMPNGNVKDLKDKKYTKKYGDTNNYSYGCKEHEFKFHIYRITRLSVSGENIDMSQKELESWCTKRNLPYTFEIHPPIIYDGDEETLRTLCEILTERDDVLCEDYEFSDMIGEGIIVRVENGNKNPDFYKSKNFAFRVMEQGLEVPDTETIS